jgi:hypothetical protein
MRTAFFLLLICVELLFAPAYVSVDYYASVEKPRIDETYSYIWVRQARRSAYFILGASFVARPNGKAMFVVVDNDRQFVELDVDKATVESDGKTLEIAGLIGKSTLDTKSFHLGRNTATLPFEFPIDMSGDLPARLAIDISGRIRDENGAVEDLAYHRELTKRTETRVTPLIRYLIDPSAIS